MDKRSILERIEALTRPILGAEGMELVDLEFKKEGKNWYLRVFIDKPGGVTLNDCQNVSNQLGVILDIEEIIDHRYILEVSSPGLDRPLKKIEDYYRFQGRLVRVNTSATIMGRKRFIGRIAEVDQEGIRLQLEHKERVFIPYGLITKARLEVEF